MAKVVKAVLTLQIPAGKANPAPPLGPALGQHGVAIQDFCNQYNNETKDRGDWIIPCILTVYDDRSFDFILKEPPAADLMRKAAKIDKGSGEPNKTKVATLQWSELVKIAEGKLVDMNANTPEAGAHMLAGTARSMGIVIEGKPEKK